MAICQPYTTEPGRHDPYLTEAWNTARDALRYITLSVLRMLTVSHGLPDTTNGPDH
ncbi:hypothetical protein ACGFNU_47385 [Spirillospora sp. NPDC048911]|uniref:hypothetical protein n=1 Tax=Spirillospora sp. NPDC048911 TaxID=3364527 RepID=UPI003722D51D